MKAERELGIGPRRERDAAGAGQRETRGRRVDLAAELFAAHGECAGHLSDAFLGGEQIVDAKPDVVAGVGERAAAAGGEVGKARQRRSREAQRRNRVDRNASAVGVERVRRIPSDERCPRDGAGALRDLNVVEPHARAVESHGGGCLLKRLAVCDAFVDRHPAKADGAFVLPRQMEISGQQS